MSAIVNKSNGNFPGIHVYRTRIKLVIHSHNSAPPVVLGQEITAFSVSKQIKGVGTAVFSFVPSANFLNKIFPNDYINLYIDRADGEGWTRTFFGFVDRIQENYSVDANGTPHTSYSITCSDFTKVFDKTNIYFNPHIDATRKDFDGSWVGALNTGGIALQTKGVSVTGSPPDVLLNNIFVMLGASSQFVLPSGYTPRTKDKFREERANFVIKRLQSDVLKAVPKGDTVAQYIANLEKVIEAKAPFSAGALLPENSSDEARQAAMNRAAEIAKKYENVDTLEAQQLKAVLATTNPKVRASFLDILDVFTFCERGAIDGYSQDVTWWQYEGSLLSLLMQQSNELVNELFFDLRPTIDSAEKALADGDNWSRAPDEIGYNVADKTDSTRVPTGVRYVPAVVYREYPFATVADLDASALKLSLNGSDGQPFSVGKIQFGAIFSDRPNIKGRHVIEVNNINYEDNKKGVGTAGKTQKHIDVAVISPTEIISSALGRSDAEHYNLTQYYSDALLGENARFFMHDIVPITNAIGITRHGLRVRDLKSNFARFADFGVPTVTPETQKKAEDATDTVSATPVSTGTVILPIAADEITSKSVYGWRPRGPEGGHPARWRWHHGHDFGAVKGTLIRAVADGYVVGVVPAGTEGFDAYGNVIIIKHLDKYNGETIFSLYAHMNSFHPDNISGNPNRERSKKQAVSKDVLPVGRMSPFFIKAGTVIGTVGNTVKADAKGTPQEGVSGPGGAHLHFEIIKKYPSKTTNDGIPAPVLQPNPRPADPSPEVVAKMSSINPQIWFASHGIDILHPTTVDPVDDDKNDEESDTALDTSKDVNTDAVSTNALSNTIDGPRIRSQIARWALLDDHWYQHNIEYLSGTITMRGAPEIRVGYRLDINDPIRPLSFYVEGVEHNWEYPNAMTTTLTVTRGQPNSPFPVYVLPYFKGFREDDVQRKEGSRLGEFFLFPAPTAARHGTFYSANGSISNTHQEDIVNPDEKLSLNPYTSGEMYIRAGESLNLDDVRTQTKTMDSTDASVPNSSRIIT